MYPCDSLGKCNEGGITWPSWMPFLGFCLDRPFSDSRRLQLTIWVQTLHFPPNLATLILFSLQNNAIARDVAIYIHIDMYINFLLWCSELLSRYQSCLSSVKTIQTHLMANTLNLDDLLKVRACTIKYIEIVGA